MTVAFYDNLKSNLENIELQPLKGIMDESAIV